MEERKREEAQSVLKIRMCRISRPKVLVLGYFIMCFRIFRVVHMERRGLSGCIL
jgi:hypothetical protein